MPSNRFLHQSCRHSMLSATESNLGACTLVPIISDTCTCCINPYVSFTVYTASWLSCAKTTGWTGCHAALHTCLVLRRVQVVVCIEATVCHRRSGCQTSIALPSHLLAASLAMPAASSASNSCAENNWDLELSSGSCNQPRQWSGANIQCRSRIQQRDPQNCIFPKTHAICDSHMPYVTGDHENRTMQFKCAGAQAAAYSCC